MSATSSRDIRIKRIYDPPAKSDGYRVLVDRLWPRGVNKNGAALNEWLREIAPSDELRKWFGHDPKRWAKFAKRYRVELALHSSELQELRRRAVRERVTLLYGAKDPKYNQAVALRNVLLHR